MHSKKFCASSHTNTTDRVQMHHSSDAHLPARIRTIIMTTQLKRGHSPASLLSRSLRTTMWLTRLWLSRRLQRREGRAAVWHPRHQRKHSESSTATLTMQTTFSSNSEILQCDDDVLRWIAGRYNATISPPTPVACGQPTPSVEARKSERTLAHTGSITCGVGGRRCVALEYGPQERAFKCARNQPPTPSGCCRCHGAGCTAHVT